MEPITVSTNTQHAQAPARVQELIIDFLRIQTNLSIRLSENLQDLSRDLLDRIRKVMADKVPLDWGLNNCSLQTIFGLASTIGTGLLQMEAAKASFEAAPLHLLKEPPRSAPETEKIFYNQEMLRQSELNNRKNLMGSTASIVQSLSQIGGAYLGGRGECFGFNAQELQQLQHETAACLKTTRESQESLTATVKQISSHS